MAIIRRKKDEALEKAFSRLNKVSSKKIRNIYESIDDYRDRIDTLEKKTMSLEYNVFLTTKAMRTNESLRKKIIFTNKAVVLFSIVLSLTVLFGYIVH